MSDMNPQVNLTNATDSRNNQIATAASNLTINVHNDRLTSGRKESLELDAEEAADSMSGLEVSKQRQIELEEKKLKAARHPCSEYSNLIQKRMTQREQKYFDSGDYNLAISSGASAGGGIGGGGDSGDSSSCIGGSSGVGGGISGSTGGGIIGSASGSIIGSTGSVINSGSIVEERVKVDRKRFEQMLGENSNFGCDADSFFRRVMRSTNTQIMWPPKLKPGTKSKKDPHVRITGSPNSINAAKEIIFEQLDTRRNRVTLKMDVAFTDHSHIIGKGGRSIQRVMDETGCHIHFPDSNRTNTAEKSNQVSIAGSAEGVEQSRCRIREMLPINLQFDLPLNNGLHSPPTLDPQSPQLQAIQQTYGITISFKCDGSKCSNNSYFASSRIITVAVRGARSHLFGLRQGLSVLIEYLTGFRANTINVPLTMTLDVAVQHHSFIAGRANCNIRAIMQSTGVVITMPDNLATQIPPNGIPGQLGSGAMSSIASSLSSIAGAVSGASSSSSATLSSPTNAQASVGSQATSAVSASETPSVTTATTSSSFSDLTSLCGQQLSSSSTSFMTALTNQNFHHGSNPNLASNAPAVSLAGAATSNNNRKTAIVIKGPNFESVYGAWQELLGYLPLILIFDLKEGQDLDPVQVTKLMEQMRQISILIKPKQRQNTKSIVVRGPEKDSRLLFEVRKQILKSDDSELQAYSAPDGQHKQQQQPQQLQQSQPNAQQHPQNQQTTSQQLTSITQQRPTSSQINDPEMQLKAIRAILEPNLEKTRHPTPYWAGLGFSKSVSEPMVKEKLSMGPLFSSNIAEERRISYSNEGVIQDLANSLQSLSSGQMSTSGKFFTNFVNDNNNNTTSSGSTNMSNSTACNNHNNNHGYVGQNNKQCVGTGVAHADSNNNSTISHKQPQQGSNMGENYNIKSEPNHVTSTIMDINNNLTKLSSNSMHNIGATNNSMSSCNTGRLVSGHSSVSSPTNHPNVGSNQKISSCLRLAMFLGRIGLVQYLGLLTQHGIDLEMLFTLNESDFAELGLPFVHRRKLSIAIAEVKSSIQNERVALSSLASTFDAAPGAERSRRQKARCSTRGNELNEAWPM